MDAIAYMIGEIFIYWNSIIMTLAVATAVCFFASFYLKDGGTGLAAAAVLPAALVLAMFCARCFHWYSRWDSYAGFTAAVTDYSVGGYALIGVFAGCALAAALIRLLQISDDLPRMLDGMCMGGAAGIAVGRLACLYSAADRGQILETLTELPWAYPVTNAVSGTVEYRLATFVIQAMVAGTIFVLLAAFSFYRRRRSGDLCLLFLLSYCASQVVLDSTRYDSLYFRSNGFVSIVQVACAVAMVLVLALLSWRMVRSKGFRKWYSIVWVLLLALLGGAGYMEYHVQRHGDQAVFAYSIMSSCLAAVVLVGIWLYTRSLPRYYAPAVPEPEAE